MAKYETGDIIIFMSVTFGHVSMCYSPGDNEAKFIHAQFGKNFHIDQQLTMKGSSCIYFVNRYYSHFRPRNITQQNKQQLKKVADTIAEYAIYGGYRAVRLELGDSSFGKGAQARLKKYKTRSDTGANKFVSTITCSEAVILCNQLTFEEPTPEKPSPLFILKDAAHTMPKTLEKYLKDNPNWENKKTYKK